MFRLCFVQINSALLNLFYVFESYLLPFVQDAICPKILVLSCHLGPTLSTLSDGSTDSPNSRSAISLVFLKNVYCHKA